MLIVRVTTQSFDLVLCHTKNMHNIYIPYTILNYTSPVEENLNVIFFQVFLLDLFLVQYTVQYEQHMNLHIIFLVYRYHF